MLDLCGVMCYLWWKEAQIAQHIVTGDFITANSFWSVKE